MRSELTCVACELPALVQWRRHAPTETDPDVLAAVYACGTHAIGLAAAALVHRAECPAPDPKRLPACGCTPDPAPTPEPGPDAPVETLPTGWTVPTGA